MKIGFVKGYIKSIFTKPAVPTVAKGTICPAAFEKLSCDFAKSPFTDRAMLASLSNEIARQLNNGKQPTYLEPGNKPLSTINLSYVISNNAMSEGSEFVDCFYIIPESVTYSCNKEETTAFNIVRAIHGMELLEDIEDLSMAKSIPEAGDRLPFISRLRLTPGTGTNDFFLKLEYARVAGRFSKNQDVSDMIYNAVLPWFKSTYPGLYQAGRFTK